MPIHIGMLGTLYFYASGLEGGVEKILFKGVQIFQKFCKKYLWHFLTQEAISLFTKMEKNQNFRGSINLEKFDHP